MTISVIIPTYHRPSLLKEAINSVLQQTVLPDEIVIGDDSDNMETEELISSLQSSVPMSYFHHQPSLKQTKNVDFLFRHAIGDLILLLHDDDMLYPQCLELLKEPFNSHPEIIASFGNQSFINDEGEETGNAESTMRDYFKTPEMEGIVDGFFAGVTTMFPNDAFLVRKEEAVKIGYDDNGKLGDAVDYYFGYRLGKLRKPFFYVNKYTAKYRLTSISISKSSGNDTAYRIVRLLLDELTIQDITPEIRLSIERRMRVAIPVAAKKDKKTAIKWFFSSYYRKKIVTLRGIKNLLLIINPFYLLNGHS